MTLISYSKNNLSITIFMLKEIFNICVIYFQFLVNDCVFQISLQKRYLSIKIQLIVNLNILLIVAVSLKAKDVKLEPVEKCQTIVFLNDFCSSQIITISCKRSIDLKTNVKFFCNDLSHYFVFTFRQQLISDIRRTNEEKKIQFQFFIIWRSI